MCPTIYLIKINHFRLRRYLLTVRGTNWCRGQGGARKFRLKLKLRRHSLNFISLQSTDMA